MAASRHSFPAFKPRLHERPTGPDVTIMLACSLQRCSLVHFWRQDQQSSIQHKSERLFLLGIKNPIQHVPEDKMGLLYRHRGVHVITMEMSQLTFLQALFVASIDQDATTYMHSLFRAEE